MKKNPHSLQEILISEAAKPLANIMLWTGQHFFTIINKNCEIRTEVISRFILGMHASVCIQLD